jgi:hypothetical protein
MLGDLYSAFLVCFIHTMHCCVFLSLDLCSFCVLIVPYPYTIFCLCYSSLCNIVVTLYFFTYGLSFVSYVQFFSPPNFVFFCTVPVSYNLLQLVSIVMLSAVFFLLDIVHILNFLILNL